jgi:hypothetical protein
MKQATQNIIERLKKLIRLHKSAQQIGNIGEAEAAMLAINRLLTEYNLSLFDICEGDEPPKVDIVKGNGIRFATGPEFLFVQNLIQVIAKYNYCKALFGGIGTSSPSMTLVGNAINVQTCQFLFSFLRNNFTYNADKNARKYSLEPSKRMGFYRDFLYGTVEGIARKFENEITEQTTAMVLFNSKAIDKYFEENNVNHIKLSIDGRSLNADAYWKGEEHGRKVQIKKGIENQNNNIKNLK